MSFRDLCSRDIDRLVALDARLFADDAWPASTWWAELAERPRREYIGWVTDDGDGTASLMAYGGLDLSGEAADVMTIAVAPEAQGRGLGARVLAELEARALARGAQHGLLEVRADNAAARSLYERAGWRELHVRRRYYQPGDVDAIILGKALGENGSGERRGEGADDE